MQFVTAPNAFQTQDALTQIAKRTIASHCTKQQATPTHPNGTHSLLVQVEGYAPVCMLERGVCSWASRGCSGHLIFRPLWIRLLAKVSIPDPEKVDARVRLHAEPYPAAITPRSPEKAERIKYEWKQAQK